MALSCKWYEYQFKMNFGLLDICSYFNSSFVLFGEVYQKKDKTEKTGRILLDK